MRKMTRNMSFGQRLNTALLALVLLLLVGVGLVLWMQESKFSAEHRGDQLSDIKDRLLRAAVVSSEAVRGLSLDPKDSELRNNKKNADAELTDLDRKESLLPNNTKLRRAFDELRSFINTNLIPFHAEV